MRRVISWNMVTLDGFFEGPQRGEIDWFTDVWGEELERYSLEQSRSIGALLFGRVTYQGMAAYWPAATGEIAEFMNSIPKVVFSTTMAAVHWNNSRLFTGKPEEEVARLKQQPGKDLYIFGSANLSAALIHHGLIDEYRLALNPLVLGGGTPLFKRSPTRLRMRLLEARPLSSGVVLLRYEPA